MFINPRSEYAFLFYSRYDIGTQYPIVIIIYITQLISSWKKLRVEISLKRFGSIRSAVYKITRVDNILHTAGYLVLVFRKRCTYIKMK